MKLASVDAIVRALDAARVRYLVAGDLAVNAHGYMRFTKDVDLVVHLDRSNVDALYSALESLEFRPIVAVAAAQLADREQRETWIRDKGMQVLQFWSDAHPQTPVDVFVVEPFDFEEEHARALVKTLGGVGVRIVSLRTLIKMKEQVGRLQDLADVEQLRQREQGDPNG